MSTALEHILPMDNGLIHLMSQVEGLPPLSHRINESLETMTGSVSKVKEHFTAVMAASLIVHCFPGASVASKAATRREHAIELPRQNVPQIMPLTGGGRHSQLSRLLR